MTKGSTTWEYTYNADGLRTKRTDGTDTYEYVYLDGQLVQLTVNDNGTEVLMKFAYDADGTPLSITYKGTTYYYVTNLQGDVLGVVNQSGNLLLSYTYDAWGNILSVGGSNKNTMGKYNPLRYRGYVYDEGTGLYYLQSRYYDPEMGRFLNADNQMADVGGDILGFNMYEYCHNNPVMYSDPTGHWPQWIKNAVKWVATNIIKPVVKTVQTTISKTDRTYSYGVNISGTPSAVIFNVQAGVSIDTKGNVAIQGSYGGGFTAGSPGASATLYKSVTNAPSIDKLEGMGYQIGGSAEIYGAAAGLDVNVIPDKAENKIYLGLTGSAGFGTPGGEFHIEWGETGTWKATSFNIFDVADEVYDRIMEW